MKTGNDNCPSHTRGWYHMSSLEGVPRCLPRSGVPQNHMPNAERPEP